MHVIVLLIYHGYGHFNACLRLAKVLSSRFKVVFAGFAFFEKYVVAQGFTFYSLRTVPFGLGFEDWVNTIEKKKNVYFHTLHDRWTNRLYSLRERDLFTMLDTLRPDYLLIDSWQSTDFIVLYQQLKKHQIKTAVIQTMLSTRLKKDIPPLNSTIFPGNALAIKSAHTLLRFQQSLKTLTQFFKYVGKTNSAIIRKKISNNNIPEKYFLKQSNIFSPALNHLSEIILATREFEFPSRYASAFEYYTGFFVDKERNEISDPSFEKIFSKVQKKIENGSRLIYCAFGTVEQKKPKKTIRFLEKVMTAAEKLPDDVFLLAGNVHKLLQGINCPENVFTTMLAPQLNVLRYASIFITHGGLNSIKEAINAFVPLLVYPVNKITDNNGVAARIVFHRLGLRGDLSKDSPDAIAQKIKTLLNDPGYKNNLREMHATNDAYPEEKIFEIINQVNVPD